MFIFNWAAMFVRYLIACLFQQSLNLCSSSLLLLTHANVVRDSFAVPNNSSIQSKTMKQFRSRRDERENIGRAYGRGIGFFVGEPCKEKCDAILFHVECNRTSQQCECMRDYPVNLDNRVCVRALKLGSKCEYDASCKYYDGHAICHASDAKCSCEQGYFPRLDGQRDPMCIPGKGIYWFAANVEIMTLLSIIAGLLLFAIVFFAVLKLLGKARYGNSSDHRFTSSSLSAPPAVILTNLDHFASSVSSRRASSVKSVSNEFLPPSRRPSYSMLAPPSNLASRRQSLSSIRSQSSLRSLSSFRSQSSFRNYRGFSCGGREFVNRTFPSPVTTPLSPHEKPFVNTAQNQEKCAFHSNPSVPKQN